MVRRAGGFFVARFRVRTPRQHQPGRLDHVADSVALADADGSGQSFGQRALPRRRGGRGLRAGRPQCHRRGRALYVDGDLGWAARWTDPGIRRVDIRHPDERRQLHLHDPGHRLGVELRERAGRDLDRTSARAGPPPFVRHLLLRRARLRVGVRQLRADQRRRQPLFWMLAHISLASGVCYGDYNSGCTVKLPYSGGPEGVMPSVRLAGVGMNPNRGCWDPSATSPPKGAILTAGGGYVTVVIPNRLINGYGAVWTIVISDQNLCSAGTNCVSPAATVTIGVQCG